MPAVNAISLSGLRAAQQRLDASAHNIANQATPAFRRQQVVQAAMPAGGVSSALSAPPQSGGNLEQDIVDSLAAKGSFLANLAVLRRSDSMLGSLLDTQA